jgi:hypothetical protein
MYLFSHTFNKFEGQAAAGAGAPDHPNEAARRVRGRSRFAMAARSQVGLGGLDGMAL